MADASQVQPDWKTDGFGLRGPQPDLPVPKEAAPASMEFGIGDRRTLSGGGESGKVTLQTGAFYGGYAGVVTDVDTITFDESLFQIQDDGGGNVLVSLITTTCP